jgi:hypothetical protein
VGQKAERLVIFWLYECLTLVVSVPLLVRRRTVAPELPSGVLAKGINRIPRYVSLSVRVRAELATWHWGKRALLAASAGPGQPAEAAPDPDAAHAAKMNIGHVCDGISVTGPLRQLTSCAAPDRWR